MKRTLFPATLRLAALVARTARAAPEAEPR